MDSSGIGRCLGCQTITFVRVALALALLGSAGAGRSYGEATLADSSFALSSLGQLRPATPALVTRPSTSSVAGPQPIVHVAWYDTEHRLHARLDVIAAQVTGFFRRAGVTLVSRQGVVGVGTEDAMPDEIPVILLAADTFTARRARPVLGTTKRSREGTFIVTVFVAPIHETLRLGPIQRALNPMEADQLAQALERVVVHELVHALAPAQAHSERGLMRRSFARADLLSALNVGDAQAVRTLLAGTGQAATAPVGS